MGFYLYINEWYGLCISLRAAIIAQGQRPRAMMGARRSNLGHTTTNNLIYLLAPRLNIDTWV